MTIESGFLLTLNFATKILYFIFLVDEGLYPL
jgi:hypothetical protein